MNAQPITGRPLPEPLHHDSLSWLDPLVPPKAEWPPVSDNSPWARARRSPSSTFSWRGSNTPSLGQVWNVVHAIYLAHPIPEYFRLTLLGEGKDVLRDELLATGLAIEHPQSRNSGEKTAPSVSEELLILRGAGGRGAAAPAGPRPGGGGGEGGD